MNRIEPRNIVPSQLNVLMADGTAMSMVVVMKIEAESGSHTTLEHVVSPDNPPQKRDGDHSVDHRAVSEDRFPRKDSNQFGGDTHAG